MAERIDPTIAGYDELLDMVLGHRTECSKEHGCHWPASRLPCRECPIRSFHGNRKRVLTLEQVAWQCLGWPVEEFAERKLLYLLGVTNG